MRIERLHLHPFAGTLDREVRFAPGLNVILGPNEAGKSTLRRALRHLLFVSTKLAKRQNEIEVLPNLPLGGGDTLRISGDFVVDGENWHISKRWAGNASSIEVKPPDGGILTELAAAEKRLSDLCGLTPGTWEHVLMAPQGELGHSLDRIDPERDLAELNQRLRRAVFETDGVSLEALAAGIEKRWQASFGRWDREMGRPEGNRGLDNRWTKETGRIVLAWYAVEQARVTVGAAEAYHRDHDAVVAMLSQARARREREEQWVVENEAIARDATERAGVEAELAKIETRGKGLKEISQEWPVVLSQLSEREKEMTDLSEKVALLGRELEAARAWEAAAESRRILAEAEKLSIALGEAKIARDAAGTVDPKEIERLEGIQRERDRIRVRMEAAVLRVKFSTGSAVSLETVSGVGDPETRELGAGEKIEFTTGGRVLVKNAEQRWELEVSSGELDLAAEEKRESSLAQEFVQGIAQLGVTDLGAAKTRLADAMEKTRRIKTLESQLGELLGSMSLEERRSASGAATGASEPARSADRIAEERGAVEGRRLASEREATALRKKAEVWTRDHGSPDELIDTLADLRGEHRAAKQKLEALRPLPEGFADATRFLHEFRRRQADLQELRGEEGRHERELVRVEGTFPGIEVTEAIENLRIATDEFDRSLRDGQAIDRIRDDFRKLRASIDDDTLGPWQKHLGEILAPLTEDRYQSLSPHDSVVSRSDDVKVPFAVLSAGAKASLGLAVRLAMARWFLEGREGFVFLDDPLVDLDPARQQAAAAMLQRFAEEKQVIILTCHPAHADILGGNRIQF